MTGSPAYHHQDTDRLMTPRTQVWRAAIINTWCVMHILSSESSRHLQLDEWCDHLFYDSTKMVFVFHSPELRSSPALLARFALGSSKTLRIATIQHGPNRRNVRFLFWVTKIDFFNCNGLFKLVIALPLALPLPLPFGDLFLEPNCFLNLPLLLDRSLGDDLWQCPCGGPLSS